MSLHTTFYRGKRVFVQMRNGAKFVDRWSKDSSRCSSKRYAEFESHGTIPLRDIRSITIYRGSE
jgi:hypothetical protein